MYRYLMIALLLAATGCAPAPECVEVEIEIEAKRAAAITCLGDDGATARMTEGDPAVRVRVVRVGTMAYFRKATR